MPRAYLAFSQVVADNQYASLGLMLVGTLAKVKKVIESLRGESGRVSDEGLQGGEFERVGRETRSMILVKWSKGVRSVM